MMGYLLAILVLTLATSLQTPNAIVLNNENYSSEKANNRVLFVEYFKPTCGYCVQMAPKIDDLALHFKDTAKVKIGTVNIEQQKKISIEEDINVYPTMKAFINGEAIEYKGKHETQSMIDFIMELHMARLLIVPKIADARPPAVIVTGIQTGSNLQALPALFSRYPVYYTKEPAHFTLQILKKDNSTLQYEGEPKLTVIAEWLELETSPILLSLGSSKVPLKLQKAMEKRWPILAFFNRKNEAKKDEVHNALKALQSYCSYVQNFVCGYVNKGEDDYQNLNSLLGDSQGDQNKLSWIDVANEKVYLMEEQLQNLNIEKITQFVENIQQNKIKPHRTFGQPQISKKSSGQQGEL